jgi:hypothetical protein
MLDMNVTDIEFAVELADNAQDVDRKLAEMAMSEKDRILAQSIQG